MPKIPIIFQQSKLLSGIPRQAPYILFDNERKRPAVLKATEPQRSKMLLN